VEKLESVLRAEDEARNVVATARDEALETLVAAKSTAAQEHAAIISEAKERSAQASTAVLARAHDDAEQIAGEARVRREAERAFAASRLESAVASVMAELVG